MLASAANYMICDDHEFVDNLGKSKRWGWWWMLVGYCPFRIDNDGGSSGGGVGSGDSGGGGQWRW